MRNALVGLVLGLIMGLSIAYTQQQQERIYIGEAAVQIGMLKETVISKLAEKGYHLSKVEGREEWAVQEKNEQTNLWDVRGMLDFANGRLSWASRSWVSSFDPGSAKLVRNLYFLAKSFEDSGNTGCTIETNSNEAPEFESKGVKIRCAKRAASLYVAKYKEQEPATSLDETIQ
jgi:hypothetical protein